MLKIGTIILALTATLLIAGCDVPPFLAYDVGPQTASDIDWEKQKSAHFKDFHEQEVFVAALYSLKKNGYSICFRSPNASMTTKDGCTGAGWLATDIADGRIRAERHYTPEGQVEQSVFTLKLFFVEEKGGTSIELVSMGHSGPDSLSFRPDDEKRKIVGLIETTLQSIR